MKNQLFGKIISYLLVVLMVFSFWPAASFAAVNNSPDEVAALLTSISQSYKNTADDWTAMDMAAYGRADDVAGADIVKKAREVYINGKVTDIARTVITLTALGVDASNVYGGSEGVYLDFIAKLGTSAPSQVMEAIFGLIALDSGEYEDNGLAVTRATYLHFLLNQKLTPAAGQTAWAVMGSSTDVDVTAMAIAALSPYYGHDQEVKAAIDGSLNYLSIQQNNLGNYASSNSTSMVIVALTALGKDPGSRTGDFAKNGKSLIDGLLAFRTGSDQLGYDDNLTASTLSTEQGFRALVAYQGYLNANGAYKIYQFGKQTGDGSKLTGVTDPGGVLPDPSAPKSVTVRIENLYDGVTLIPETKVKLSGTHFDALEAALSANGYNPGSDLTEFSGFISSILGVSGGSTTGWMYAINGEIPLTMLNETSIAEGDVLILFFIDWYDVFYFTSFDQTAVNLKPGGALTLTLTGLNPWAAAGSGGVYAPVAGATVFKLDSSGNKIGSGVATGADGRATLIFLDSGTYTVSAARPGAVHATELIPPLCSVTVTSSGTPSDPDKMITVYFTLQGLNSGSGHEETWINGKAISNIADGSSAAEVIIKALAGTGYTQSGAENGYIKSITTPGGFTLSEMDNGMANSGWLYKVNSQLPTAGMDSYIVKNGDQLLLYFTKDYTKDPDAGTVSGGGSKISQEEGKAAVSSELNITMLLEAGVAIFKVDSGSVEAVLKNIIAELTAANDTDALAEIKVTLTELTESSALQLDFKAEDLKTIADAQKVQLSLESAIAALTFDPQTLAGLVKGAADEAIIQFIAEAVDITQLDSESQKMIGDSPVFNLSIIVGDTPIHDFDGTVTVFLPFTPEDGIDPATLTVYYLDENKNAVAMENVYYDDQRKGFVFTTTHFSLFIIAKVSAEWINPYTDVKTSDWFYEAVKYVNLNNLMTGTAKDRFDPNSPITRAMLVTLLYRHEGEPLVSSTSPFTDAEDEKWYTNSVIWAYESGIITGYGGGLFGTNDNVTREQLAAVLSNYAQKQGIKLSVAADLSAYEDIEEISSWALEAMKSAKAAGWISGRSADKLAPKEAATRAEAAMILMGFIENITQ